MSKKLEVIEPPPFSPRVSRYLQPGVFPEIPGGSDISPAGELINAKYGHLGLIIYIWFTVGRLMCHQPSPSKTDVSKDVRPEEDDMIYDDEFDTVVPDLVLDKFDPILISYAGSREKWYLQITLATLNNLWCSADWTYSVKHRTETSKTTLTQVIDPSKKSTRLDTLSDFKITVKIPEFWGYVRFKILDGQQNSHQQTSGCIKYVFKQLTFDATVTTKLIDKRFRTKEHKWRAPDIEISYNFEDVNYQIMWYPFVGDRVPADGNIQIPNLTQDKIKTIIDDIFNEKIKQNREEFLKRYIRSVLERLIPRVVEECRSKVDIVLTFATVLANGTDDDLYNVPPTTGKLVKLAVYSVAKQKLRDQILQLIAPHFKMPESENVTIENKLNEVERAMEKLRQFG